MNTVRNIMEGKYIHIAFADSKRGLNFTKDQPARSYKYIGTYSSNSSISSTDPKDYSWKKLK